MKLRGRRRMGDVKKRVIAETTRFNHTEANTLSIVGSAFNHSGHGNQNTCTDEAGDKIANPAGQ